MSAPAPAPTRASLVAAAASTLLVLAAVAFAAVRARPPRWEAPRRLLDEAIAQPARLSYDAPPAPLLPPLLQRWPFTSGRAGWLALDREARAAGAGDDGPRTHRREDGSAGQRFPAAAGGLIHVLPMAANRLLRAVAVVRRAPPDHGDPLAPRAATRLFAQPALRLPDLAAELRETSFLDFANRRDVRILDEPLLATGSAPADGERHELSITFATPAGTQSLILFFAAGDGSAPGAVDVEEVRLEEVPLREALALGAAPAAAPPDPRFARSENVVLAELGLEPAPLEALPALRCVAHLLERRTALLLPPGARAHLDFELPAGDWVLEYGVARVHEARRSWGRGSFELTAGVAPPGSAGTEQATALAPLEPAGWIDRTLEIERHPGGQLRLALECQARGATSDVAAIGAPIVRRRGARDDRWNVVLVSLDTVRADHLSAHGYPRPTTPALDALAAECAWFRDASSTSSYTLPAHASLLTGQLPTRHGAHSFQAGRNRIWSDRSDLLAVRLRAHGWLTAAFTGGIYLGAGFGFDQGFDRYDETDLALPHDAARARQTPRAGDPEFNAAYRKTRPLRHALDWIRARADAPFFLFLHTYLVHEYQAAPEHEARFLGSVSSGLARGDLRFIRDRTLAEKPAPGDLQRYVDAYDATLREADAQVGELLALLDELRLAERTIVVVTSDHGEEFLDHGGVNHGRTLHEEMVRVPLLIRVPGWPAREIDLPVSLLDVAPTLLELCGVAGGAPVDGRSLVALLRGGSLPEAPIEAELDLVRENRWTMRREGACKALGVHDERTPAQLEEGPPRAPSRSLVFEVGVDPRETLDLAQGSAAEMARAADRLDALEAQRDAARERREAARRESSATSGSGRHDLGLGGYTEASDPDAAVDDAPAGERTPGGVTPPGG